MLFIGGTGELQAELTAKIEGTGLGKRLRLLGFIPDDCLSTAYQAADIAVVPSQSLEGFGLSVLESLACGTPVLVTPVGGLPEAVSRLDPRLVLPAKDSAAIANGLDVFLRREVLLPRSVECRKYVELNFAWPIIAQQVKNLYRQVVNR
jgi:glycosyltransferase involved in cell wall biosynthesis